MRVGSSWHGPGMILDEDIVLVTINYRLGPFGFLSLSTPEYSGNMGIKDQLLALKWVNENIEYFGGKFFVQWNNPFLFAFSSKIALHGILIIFKRRQT